MYLSLTSRALEELVGNVVGQTVIILGNGASYPLVECVLPIVIIEPLSSEVAGELCNIECLTCSTYITLPSETANTTRELGIELLVYLRKSPSPARRKNIKERYQVNSRFPSQKPIAIETSRLLPVSFEDSWFSCTKKGFAKFYLEIFAV